MSPADEGAVAICRKQTVGQATPRNKSSPELTVENGLLTVNRLS